VNSIMVANGHSASKAGFWGLVEQKGPWKQTSSDIARSKGAGRKNSREFITPYQINGSKPPPKPSRLAQKKVTVKDSSSGGMGVMKFKISKSKGTPLEPDVQNPETVLGNGYTLGRAPDKRLSEPKIKKEKKSSLKIEIPESNKKILEDFPMVMSPAEWIEIPGAYPDNTYAVKRKSSTPKIERKPSTQLDKLRLAKISGEKMLKEKRSQYRKKKLLEIKERRNNSSPKDVEMQIVKRKNSSPKDVERKKSSPKDVEMQMVKRKNSSDLKMTVPTKSSKLIVSKKQREQDRNYFRNQKRRNSAPVAVGIKDIPIENIQKETKGNLNQKRTIKNIFEGVQDNKKFAASKKVEKSGIVTAGKGKGRMR
jgi:hypothetical protein